MCKGLGMDLCEIARMEKQLRDDRFLARFFTPGEIEYVRSRGAGAAATLAGLFAPREALGKALGGGRGGSLPYRKRRAVLPSFGQAEGARR